MLHGAAHTFAVDASSMHMHQQNGIQQLIHSAPTIEKRWSYVVVTLTKAPCPENSLATGGYFEHNTYHVTALGWLKKERKKEFKKINNSDF